MIEAPILNNQLVTVMVAQTTFAVLIMPGQQYRIDYIEKEEAYLKPGMRGEFSHCLEHPLLLGYNSRSATVYINSRPQDPEGLFIEIREQIQASFHGWRDWRYVLFGKREPGEKLLRKNILDGSGMLLETAPVIVAKAIIAACAKYGASAYCIGGIDDLPSVTPAFHLLLIGKGYVIAKDFRFVKL
ncbi:hypothetical protein A0257_01910 [Hymenobacter psoromatis]|nr:hypothetical protein A0257_01910 [Hymenobacter psoromatis]